MNTRQIVLYLGVSLDGYIADERGAFDWLVEVTGDADYEYAEFLATVDTVVMGRTTYDQVLALGDWPYRGKKAYVFTNRGAAPDPNVEFVSGDVGAFARRLRGLAGAGIWLVGGAKLVDAFLRARQIDELVITFTPILLGSGIPLFSGGTPRTPLRLIESRRYGELVQLHYAAK